MIKALDPLIKIRRAAETPLHVRRPRRPRRAAPVRQFATDDGPPAAAIHSATNPPPPASPDIFLEAAMHRVAMYLFETFYRSSDPAALIKRLKEKPELHIQLINCQANVSRADLERKKFEFQKQQAEAKQSEREQRLRARKPILLTAATLHRFRAVASSPLPDPTPTPTPNLNLNLNLNPSPAPTPILLSLPIFLSFRVYPCLKPPQILFALRTSLP